MNTLRVLALDPRPGRCGYAAFEGPGKLLNWGVEGYSWADDERLLLISIGPLFTSFRPHAIAIPDSTDWNISRESRTKPALFRIEQETRWRSLPVYKIRREEVRQVFAELGTETKYEIASAIALLFPELLWKLPRIRKPWESEGRTLSIFDAISFGLTLMARFGDIRLPDRIRGTPPLDDD